MRKFGFGALGLMSLFGTGCSVGPEINYNVAYEGKGNQTSLNLRNVRSVLLEDNQGRKIGMQGQGRRIDLLIDIEDPFRKSYRITIDGKRLSIPRRPGNYYLENTGTLTSSRNVE